MVSPHLSGDFRRMSECEGLLKESPLVCAVEWFAFFGSHYVTGFPKGESRSEKLDQKVNPHVIQAVEVEMSMFTLTF